MTAALKSVAGIVADDFGETERARIMREVGNVSWYRLLTNRVLVAVWVRPDKVIKKHDGSLGSLYMPDSVKGEDIWRGCVGLVLALGPTAFVDDATTQYGEVRPKVGDWVHYQRTSGELMKFGGHDCILLYNDTPAVRAILDRPDFVYGAG